MSPRPVALGAPNSRVWNPVMLPKPNHSPVVGRYTARSFRPSPSKSPGGRATFRVAVRVVLPRPFVVLVKTMVAGPYIAGVRPFALAFTVNVTVVGDVVTVPEVVEAVSQLGSPEIEKPTEPVAELSRYWNADGKNGPPGIPDAPLLPDGVSCRVSAAG